MSENEVKRKLNIENYEDQLKAYEAVGVEPDYATSHLVSDLKNSVSYKSDLLEALSFSEKRAVALESQAKTLEVEIGKLEKRSTALAVAVVVALISLAIVTIFFFKQTSDLKKQLSTVNQGAQSDDISNELWLGVYTDVNKQITIEGQLYEMDIPVL